VHVKKFQESLEEKGYACETVIRRYSENFELFRNIAKQCVL